MALSFTTPAYGVGMLDQGVAGTYTLDMSAQSHTHFYVGTDTGSPAGHPYKAAYTGQGTL